MDPWEPVGCDPAPEPCDPAAPDPCEVERAVGADPVEGARLGFGEAFGAGGATTVAFSVWGVP